MLLAELGFRSLEEAIGRADVLSVRSDVNLAKMPGTLDLSFITDLPDVRADRCVTPSPPGLGSSRESTRFAPGLSPVPIIVLGPEVFCPTAPEVLVDIHVFLCFTLNKPEGSVCEPPRNLCG